MKGGRWRAVDATLPTRPLPAERQPPAVFFFCHETRVCFCAHLLLMQEFSIVLDVTKRLHQRVRHLGEAFSFQHNQPAADQSALLVCGNLLRNHRQKVTRFFCASARSATPAA